MLIKLLKYEFRAAFRELLTLYVALLGIASLMRPFFLYNLSGSLTGITAMVYGALMIAVLVVSCITIIQRFTKTMLGSEGYLMHTLPVSASTHILSKLITAMVIVFAGFMVATLSMLIIAADSSFFLLIRSVLDEIKAFWYELFGENGFILGMEILFLSLLQSAQNILLIYTAACIGHLMYRGRALVSVLSYIFMSALLGEAIPFVNNALRTMIVGTEVTYNSYLSRYNSVYELLPSLITSLVLCIGLFCLVRYILENRLNLE